MAEKLLTVRQVQVAGEGDHSDGGGLMLRVRAASASWVFRYTAPTGRRREMGLGAARRGDSKETGGSLTAARELAARARAHLQTGVDPIEARHHLREAAKAADVEIKAKRKREQLTLARAARGYHERAIEPRLSSKHAAQWISSLENHVPPEIWHMPIDKVEAPALLAALSSVRSLDEGGERVPETLRRIRQRLDAVFEDAIFHKHCTSNPASAIRRKMRETLPKAKPGQFRALMAQCLERIDALNPRLNAFITLVPDARAQAAAAAQEIRAGRWRGPLHGVPVAVKDFFDTAGVRTTGGSKQMADRVPDADAAVVKKLRAAGAIIVGKTNMDAFGMATTGLTSSFGPVLNPWNAAHVPGGSSAGSACAVAAGLCYATVDTDAVGSVRLPAACCGVVGFKGSAGLISLQGVLGDGPVDDFVRWMAHAGLTTRSVLDTALMLDALSERGGSDFASRVELADRRLRIGVASSKGADAQVRDSFDQAVAALQSFSDLQRSATLPGSDAEAGIAHIVRDRAGVDATFGDLDLFVLPTLTVTVSAVAKAARDPEEAVPAENTAFANYFGLPAITLPCGFDTHGVPIGVQIVGRPGDDIAALLAAHRFEQATGWGARHPIE